MSLTEMWGITMQLTDDGQSGAESAESDGTLGSFKVSDGGESDGRKSNNLHSATPLSATAPEFEFGMHHASSDSGDDFDL